MSTTSRDGGGPDAVAARRRLHVGRETRRWRRDRGLTLAVLAERSGLNVGYLSLIENEKAVPSLDALAAIADGLDVPAAWLLLDEVPAPRVVRAADRPVRRGPGDARLEVVDGGHPNGLSILSATVPPGASAGLHAHGGEEHHVILTGRWRLSQGEHVVEAGPGDYVLWDGTVPHDAEVIGDAPGTILIVARRRES
jgi:transcriptional regulator with XRE-family HTH domain